MYLASLIDEVLESKKERLLGRPSYYYIVDVLNRGFRNKHPFKFKYETYSEYEPDTYALSGLFDMDACVKYVIFNFSSRTKKFLITHENWSEFKFAISQVCQHEAIHECQWQHRDASQYEKAALEFREKKETLAEEREYLADLDEIDAYAHDIAMEIKFYYPGHDPYFILRTINKRKKLWSYSYYKKTFRGCQWDPIKNRLFKKTYSWLSYV